MQKYGLIVFCGLALFVLFGCTEKRDFVVSVNGEKLTNEMTSRRVAMMRAVYSRCAPNATPADLKRFAQRLSAGYHKVFINDRLIAGYLVGKGLEVPKAKVNEFRKIALTRFRALGVRKWSGLDKALGRHAPEFSEQVESEARLSFFKEQLLAQNPTNITPAFVEAEIERAKAFNRRADATNAYAYARATNAWNRLRAGEDFGKVAHEMSDITEERKDRGEWANLDWKQIEPDPLLAKYAHALKPGEYSPPIEADNGLMILRVDKKDETECRMSRIFFQLPMYCRIPTREKLQDRADEAHAEVLFTRKLAELKASAKIVYGNQYVPPKKVDKEAKKRAEAKKAAALEKARKSAIKAKKAMLKQKNAEVSTNAAKKAVGGLEQTRAAKKTQEK